MILYLALASLYLSPAIACINLHRYWRAYPYGVGLSSLHCFFNFYRRTTKHSWTLPWWHAGTTRGCAAFAGGFGGMDVLRGLSLDLLLRLCAADLDCRL